jgi:hypothetical protein
MIKKHASISIDIYSPDGEITSRRDSISIGMVFVTIQLYPFRDSISIGMEFVTIQLYPFRDSISIDGGIIPLWSRCGCCMHRGTLPATAKVRGDVTVPQDLDRVRHLGFESDDVSPLRGLERRMSILPPHTYVRGY